MLDSRDGRLVFTRMSLPDTNALNIGDSDEDTA